MSVVLPASGCEMMANVRRRAISLAKSLFKKNVIGTAEVGNVNAGDEMVRWKTMRESRLKELS